MKFSSSYQPNYFSIEDILATQASVPCKTEVKFPRLGDIDPSSQSPHLESARRLDLPIWLALVLTRRRLITSELNKAYTRSNREILKAEPNVVDLLKQEQYFYEVGRILGSIAPFDEEPELKHTLIQTFQMRCKDLISLSQTSTSTDVLPRERLLSREERQLLQCGRQRFVEIEKWLSGKVSSCELAATSVANYRKRRRVDDDNE